MNFFYIYTISIDISTQPHIHRHHHHSPTITTNNSKNNNNNNNNNINNNNYSLLQLFFSLSLSFLSLFCSLSLSFSFFFLLSLSSVAGFSKVTPSPTFWGCKVYLTSCQVTVLMSVIKRNSGGREGTQIKNHVPYDCTLSFLNFFFLSLSFCTNTYFLLHYKTILVWILFVDLLLESI